MDSFDDNSLSNIINWNVNCKNKKSDKPLIPKNRRNIYDEITAK